MHRIRLLILPAVLLIACSAAEASPTVTLFVPPTLEATATQEILEPATSAPTGEATTAPAEAIASVTPNIPATPDGRPEVPAPIEADFRPDRASHVAATGRPQLIEFFTFW